MNTYAALLAAVHALLCITLASICICRLNHDVCRFYIRARLRVVLIMGGALLSLFQPLIFDTRATTTETLLVLVVVVSMVLNAGRWMNSYSLGISGEGLAHPSSNPERSTP